MVDTTDLKSVAPRACGFESRLSYHMFTMFEVGNLVKVNDTYTDSPWLNKNKTGPQIMIILEVLPGRYIDESMVTVINPSTGYRTRWYAWQLEKI